MLDKLKRLIPKMFLKEEVQTETKAERKISEELKKKIEAEPPRVYKFLDDTESYHDANILTKLWYLRGRMDWFDDISYKSALTADSSIDMLEEVGNRLSELAFEQSDWDDIASLLGLSSKVKMYHKQYEFGSDDGLDYFEPTVEEDSNIYEQIWYVRYLYDVGCIADNPETLKSAVVWIKNILAEAKEEDKPALKRILKDVKSEKTCSFFRNLRS